MYFGLERTIVKRKDVTIRRNAQDDEAMKGRGDFILLVFIIFIF
jgi:hypothetical protein